MFEDYYIVSKKILPPFFEAVVKVRNLTANGMNISEAVKKEGISRSTYYKYKDYILEPVNMKAGRKAVLSMILSHENGILSQVLSLISKAGGNVLTINQSLPIHSKASVTISLDVSLMQISIQSLLTTLSSQSGVESPKLIAVE